MRRSLLTMGRMGMTAMALSMGAPSHSVPQQVSFANFGITDWTPLVGVVRVGAGYYQPSLEAADFLADLVGTTTVQIYYVDPTRPDNSGNGLTAGTAKRDLSAAWALAPASQTNRIKVITPSSRILWGARGTTTAASTTKNIIVEADDGGEIIIAGGALTAPPSWTDNGDGTYTCSSGVTSGSAPSYPVDYSPEARALQQHGYGYAYTQTTGSTDAQDAGIRAALTPGTAYKRLSVGINDLTIRPLGDAAPAVWQSYLVPGSIIANVLLMKAENTTSADIRFHLSRVLVNGGTPIIFQNRRTSAGGQPIIVLDRCAAIASAPLANGIVANAACQMITYDCGFDAIMEDGFNPHSIVAGQATWVSGQTTTVDIRPRLGRSGIGLSGTGNLLTGHEDTRGMVMMPNGGIDAGGRAFHFIDNSKMTVFGGNIGPSTRTADSANQTVQAGGAATGAQITLVEVGVAVSPGAIDIGADVGGTAAVQCYGMYQGVLRTSGSVTFSPMPALA